MPAIRAGTATFLRRDEPLARAAGRTIILGFLAVIVVAVALVWSGGTLATIFLTYVVAVVGLGIYMGNSGIMSFGHAGFMGLAAYASGLLSMESRQSVLPRFPEAFSDISVPVFPGAAIALVVVAIFAGILGLAISRLSVYAAGIASLGVLVIVNTTLSSAKNVTGGTQTLSGIQSGVEWPLAFLAALIAIAIGSYFRESSAGLQLRSSREDEVAVKAIGVNVQRLRLSSWVLSATVTGAAGLLLGHFLGALSPHQFYLNLTIVLVAMLIVGGRGTVSGAVVGTALVMGVMEVLRHFESGFTLGPLRTPALFGLPTFGLAVVIVLTVYFRREGLLRVELDQALANWLVRTGRSNEPSENG